MTTFFLINFIDLEYVIMVSETFAIRFYKHQDDLKFNYFLMDNDKSTGHITQRSHIFTDFYSLPLPSSLCSDAKRSISICNAGGKSEISEMYSIDYFNRIYNSTNTILETEVNYWLDYKMVDFICTINSKRVGVSVVRAMGYPSPNNFTSEMASRILHKKLYGLIVARNSVVKNHSFYKSILHIWCQNERISQLINDAFYNLNPIDYNLDFKGILILQLTVCPDQQLYKNFLFF